MWPVEFRCRSQLSDLNGHRALLQLKKERLDRLSVEIRDRVQSRFKELHEVFVPVSMALLTNYDDAYLGIGPAPKES